jgi:hypothetical protein
VFSNSFLRFRPLHCHQCLLLWRWVFEESCCLIFFFIFLMILQWDLLI